LAVPRQNHPGEHRFLIGGIDWVAYRQIADALPGRHFHMSYDGEDLELMTISGEHGGCSRLVAFMVLILTDEIGLPRRTCGDMTLNREDLERGIEPDECFYITNEPTVRGKKIDLAVDPPPDLGVEIDLTTDSRRRFGIYAKIAVPEIWRYDGKVATIFQRTSDGQYAVAERSQFFLFLTAADLNRFLQMRDQVDETTLLRSFRQWVREQVQQQNEQRS
jgi:Uma2 family endonuclease